MINNTYELRKFLLSQLERVVDRKISNDEVKNICRLTQQIHNTLSAELRAASLTQRFGALSMQAVEFDRANNTGAARGNGQGITYQDKSMDGEPETTEPRN